MSVRFHRSRDTHPDTAQILIAEIARFHMLLQLVRHIRQDELSGVNFPGGFPLLFQFAVHLEQAAFYGCSADINAYTVIVHKPFIILRKNS